MTLGRQESRGDGGVEGGEGEGGKEREVKEGRRVKTWWLERGRKGRRNKGEDIWEAEQKVEEKAREVNSWKMKEAWMERRRKGCRKK